MGNVGMHAAWAARVRAAARGGGHAWATWACMRWAWCAPLAWLAPCQAVWRYCPVAVTHLGDMGPVGLAFDAQIGLTAVA